jgi:hypothetical protein
MSCAGTVMAHMDGHSIRVGAGPGWGGELASTSLGVHKRKCVFACVCPEGESSGGGPREGVRCTLWLHTLVLTSQLLSLSFSSLQPSGFTPSFSPSSMASSSSSSPELPLSRSTNNNDHLSIDHKLHEVLEDLSRSVHCEFYTGCFCYLRPYQSLYPQSPRCRARLSRARVFPSRTSVSVLQPL